MGCNCGSSAPANTVYKVTAGKDNIIGYADTRSGAVVIRAAQDDPAIRVAVRITQAPRSEMEAWQEQQQAAQDAA